MFWRKKTVLKTHKNTESLAETIEAIKKGNKELRECLISDYTPFILGCVSKFMNRYVEVENSEEFSVALMAFDKAIDDYESTKNPNFLSFAELVINRRLLNYVNKERKQIKSIPFSFFDQEKDNSLENAISLNSKFNYIEKCETRDEIIAFNHELKRFGITFNDLIKKTPKHKDSRQKLISVGKIIVENDNLWNKLDKKMTLPMTELAGYVDISAKTIEKNRKYIIAVCIAMKSDLEIIKGYFQLYLNRG